MKVSKKVYSLNTLVACAKSMNNHIFINQYNVLHTKLDKRLLNCR